MSIKLHYLAVFCATWKLNKGENLKFLIVCSSFVPSEWVIVIVINSINSINSIVINSINRLSISFSNQVCKVQVAERAVRELHSQWAKQNPAASSVKMLQYLRALMTSCVNSCSQQFIHILKFSSGHQICPLQSYYNLLNLRFAFNREFLMKFFSLIFQLSRNSS